MSIYIVDVEADGPCPDLYSMVSFGAVKLDDLDCTFYGKVRPISDHYISEALAVSGFSRKEHETFDEPGYTMGMFRNWIEDTTIGSPVFVSDNPAFDWQFINYYFHRFSSKNPFGFSARRIGDFAAGLNRNWRDSSSWKKYRITRHTHNPVDDAIGNAEALATLLHRVDIGNRMRERNDTPNKT